VIADAACVICSQALEPDGACPNWLCADPRRRIAKIHAIAYQSGPLKRVIGRYKYDEKYGWAAIFGRLVLGWLEQNAAQDPPDLIVANPTYTGAGGRRRPHTEQVLEAAAKEDKGGRWPFDIADPRAIIKTQTTVRSAASTAKAKRAAAAALRAALRVPDTSATARKRILVYDDVCTTASQLDAVAACLLDEGGASHVEALVLARAPWRRDT
jgi:predicted amidophosphoribosyltransferase